MLLTASASQRGCDTSYVQVTSNRKPNAITNTIQAKNQAEISLGENATNQGRELNSQPLDSIYAL